MKIRCQKDDLNFALTALSHILPTRTNLPILNGVLIFTKDDSFIMQSTDLELNLTVKIPVVVEEEGCTVVQGRNLTELVRRLPDLELTINWNETSRQLEVLYGRASAQLNTWAAEEYPSLQPKATDNKISFSGSKWKNMIKKVLFAAAAQEVRPNYAGVCFQIKNNQLNLVATDTYRLAVLTLPLIEEIPDASIFIPGRALGEVSRLLADQDQLEISWDQKAISFETERFVLTTRLLSAQFPIYEKVIPKQIALQVELNKEQLQASLERASLFIAQTDHFAIVDLGVAEDVLTVAARAADVGTLKEEISLNSTVATSCEASFNTKFLLDPLKVIDSSNITLCLNGPSGPALYLENGEETYLHLVLPVCRVSDTELV